MSRIWGRDTAPELALRQCLHGLGLRYRLHEVSLPSKPGAVRCQIALAQECSSILRIPVMLNAYASQR